jgi:hypothetical protein
MGEEAAMLRRPAVAGSWYPADPVVLADDIDAYLAHAPTCPLEAARIRAVLAPHAGLVYSGGVAAAAYGAARHGGFECLVLVGPSHYVAFDGVAAWPAGDFSTPLGPLPVAEADVRALVKASPLITVRTDAHVREHSLEMHLPFVARLFPGLPIVPLVMGAQTRGTIEALASALCQVFQGRHVLLAASSDLSHFFGAETAETLDGRTAALVGAFDVEGLHRSMEQYPLYERGRYVMCGGGPVLAVMQASRGLGAHDSVVLARQHSGHVSGDGQRVVGYLAAAFGDRGRTPQGGA